MTAPSITSSRSVIFVPVPVGPPSLSRPARRWVRWVLLALLLAATVLYTWNINAGGFSDYYATAVKSMSESWRAFFFGAFDPQATITLDKLSGFLIPQALAARVFGFSVWSLALPQVVEGIVTIGATYYIVNRWIGQIGGLLAATVMAFTPLLVSMFSHPMEDGMLTMCTTLAIAAWQRCIDTGSRRWLLLAAALVGLGFQAKMLQAWLVLPAMGLVYLWVTARTVAQKLRVLAAAAAVTVVTSFSWMSVIALFPPGQRPYIDGTTNNNIFSMVLGYNGIDRFIQNFFPGALGADPGAVVGGHTSTVGLVPGVLGHTPLKLFFPQYATQIGWFYPLVAAGLVLGVLALRRGHRNHPADAGLRAGILLSTTLLVTLTAVMSVMSLPHTAYLASLAFPLAALAAIGAILLWCTFTDRAPTRQASRLRFALPITIAVQTAWSLILIAHYPAFAGWLPVPLGIVGFGAAGILYVRALGGVRSRNLLGLAAWTALAVSLVGPMTWSASTVDPAYAGTANDAYAGPPPPGHTLQTEGTYGIGLDSNRLADQTVATEARIYDYARAHSVGRQYALATDSWRSAAPIILRGNQRVLPIGGYSSRIPSPTTTEIAALVDRGEFKYVLLTNPGSKNSTSPQNITQIHTWVHARCQLVPASVYTPGWHNDAALSTSSDRLYQCAP